MSKITGEQGSRRKIKEDPAKCESNSGCVAKIRRNKFAAKQVSFRVKQLAPMPDRNPISEQDLNRFILTVAKYIAKKRNEIRQQVYFPEAVTPQERLGNAQRSYRDALERFIKATKSRPRRQGVLFEPRALQAQLFLIDYAHSQAELNRLRFLLTLMQEELYEAQQVNN